MDNTLYKEIKELKKQLNQLSKKLEKIEEKINNKNPKKKYNKFQNITLFNEIENDCLEFHNVKEMCEYLEVTKAACYKLFNKQLKSIKNWKLLENNNK